MDKIHMKQDIKVTVLLCLHGLQSYTNCGVKKLSLCTPWQYIEGDGVQLYSILTLIENGGDWLTSCPSPFTPGEGISTSHWRGGWVGPVRWDSIVGIVTCYRLDSPDIKSRWGWGFLHPSSPGLGPTQPLIQWVLGLPGVEWLGHGDDHPLHLPHRLKKLHGYMPTLPLGLYGAF